jgi:probable O-glycosylation ligase (exosortase A-associated)
VRDIAVFAIVFLSLPIILYRPYVGALMWVWISMMNPHRLTYGMAYDFPFAMIIALTTLLAWLISPQRKPFPLTPISGLMLAFVAWMSVTSLFALQPYSVVFDIWVQVAKTQLMLFITMMLIRGRMQIDRLVWAIVISVGYFGVKGGIWTVLSGGSNRVWGPPGSWIEGNNELGLALAMLVPLMYYLASTARNRAVRYGLWGSMAACAFAILGTHSRGALLAAIAAALFLGLKSRRPVVLTVVFLVALAGAAAFMPENWADRMGTIETFEQDSSAMTRLQTWHTIWNMALHRPIVGAGFDLANPLMFNLYSVVQDQGVYAPHSIYFQALGEHGFVGLALFLALGITVWRRSGKLAVECAARPDLQWIVQLMRMTQVSLLAFAVGGAFLGLLHYDLPYYLAAIVVLANAEVKDRQASAARVKSARLPSAVGARGD